MWIAMIIALGVPIFLMYHCNMTKLCFASIPIYLIAGILCEYFKRKLLWCTPIFAYLYMILCGVWEIVSGDQIFYQRDSIILVQIVEYGSIVLLAIPIFYYNDKIYNIK